LACGIIVFGLCDIVVGTELVFKEHWSISSGVAVILGGYVSGHIVSGLAALVIDRCLVRIGLGTPADILMRRRRTTNRLGSNAPYLAII
jgi:hypothetical protein